MERETDPGEREKRPNLLLIITDQQRQPMHWPDDRDWLDSLMPADAELARTGIRFNQATIATAMCSPSRASLLTGRWPAEHGVTLTLTRGGARLNPRSFPGVLRSLGRSVRRGELTLREALAMLALGAGRRPDGGGEETELDPATPNLARILARAGYRTVLKGKWHLTQPVGEEWGSADSRRLADDLGFTGWEPPDAGENIEPEHFGGGTLAGASGMGFDEDFTRQAEAFLADPPPAPWALIVSLVNPHDVLGYPESFREGGYSTSEWSDLDRVGLPATVNEPLGTKPRAHARMKNGQASFIGGLKSPAEQAEYCRFYAHLHRLADEKIGRVIAALGDPEEPNSLRSRTVILRTSDHGEMGMSHGGMRQKMFNAYEETLNVPLIISNPRLFPEPRESEAPVSLCDILPTMAGLAGVDTEGDGIRGRSLVPILSGEAETVQEGSLFTFDDHQSGTAYRNVVPPPNRIRAWRTPDAMYAEYVDPSGGEAPEYELYDTARDPLQISNLVDRDTGEAVDPDDRELLERMRIALRAELERCGVTSSDGMKGAG
ncbi:MAG: sulfatase-like hydrolase/transferase [Solirubrobacterales bacterium]|nr:sulfatase-like hydrolase/transferase [Solirubrobacterales bacterium]